MDSYLAEEGPYSSSKYERTYLALTIYSLLEDWISTHNINIKEVISSLWDAIPINFITSKELIGIVGEVALSPLRNAAEVESAYCAMFEIVSTPTSEARRLYR